MKTSSFIIVVLLAAIACTVCYYLVDRQLVWWLYAHHSRQITILKFMSNQIPNIIGAGIFLVYGSMALQYKRFVHNKTCMKLLTACNAVVISIFLKDILKFMFGRYWPDTFVCNNPSLIMNHAYGFNWFTDGSAWRSFPSGHTTFIFAFAASMWLLFPKLRWLWILLPIMVMTGLAGLYYHFVSDIIAGAALGTMVAIYNYRVITGNNH